MSIRIFDEKHLEGASVIIKSEGFIKVNIYYYIDDEGKKVYDIESIINEFECKLKKIWGGKMIEFLISLIGVFIAIILGSILGYLLIITIPLSIKGRSRK